MFEDFQNPYKVFHHHERVHELLRTGDTRPIHMTVGLTNYCNHQCPWCYINWHQAGPLAGRSGANLPVQPAINAKDRLVEAIGEAATMGLKAVTIVGDGEPTLHPRFPKILQGIRDTGVDGGIYTNLSTPRMLVLQALAVYCFFVRLSVDAASPEVHRVTHGADDWERIISNFSYFHTYMDRPVLGVQYVVNQWNWREIPQAALFWGQQGADYISFKPAYKNQMNPDHADNEAPLGAVLALLEEAAQYTTDQFKVYTKLPQFVNLLASGSKTNDGVYYRRCQATALDIYLDEDGEVNLCGNMKGVRQSVGNVYRQTFQEIWEGQARKDWLAGIDLHQCPVACKLDPLNRVLWDAKEPDHKRLHPNFI